MSNILVASLVAGLATVTFARADDYNQILAQRQQELAQRQQELAQRQQELAQRIQELAQRQQGRLSNDR